MKLLKHIILLSLLVMAAQSVQAQLYGNEWIDYSKTYYKLKVGKDGIYRISKTALDAAGLSSVSGAQFMLFRDGQEIPIYTTTNGSFNTGDYIEFYGKKADGKLDKELYQNPNWQPDDRINMFADTAAYYLTYDTQTNHSRYIATPNVIPGTPPTPFPYCIATIGNYFLKNFCEGRNVVTNIHIPASIFDNGEGYIDTMVNVTVPLTYNLSTPNAVTNAPVNAIVNFSVLRNTYYYTPIQITANLNNQQIADSVLQPDATKQFSVSVAPNILSASNSLQLTNSGTSQYYDDYGVSFFEIQYPRNFDVSGLNYFSFKLNASASSQYLEFLNFSTGGNPPKLYDVTNKKWYSGDIAVTGKVRFYLDPSLSDRELLLYATNSSNISNITSLQTRNFINYGLSSNQGDYIIITHKNYEAITGGHNYIDDYKNYRSSIAGGSHQVVVADVTELYDQFAYGNDIHPLSIRHFLKYAYNTWNTKPHDVFLIGKGLLYYKYRQYLQNPSLYSYAGIVPTYGDIGADEDFVNFLPNRLQAINIGRFSAWEPQETGAYLDKVKAYEAALKAPALPTYSSELWKKQALHIAGGNDIGQQTYLLTTLNIAGAILKDTSYGATITTVSKATTNPLGQINNTTIDSMVNNGVSLISFNGHATSNGFDFNLNSPETYTSAPKFSNFIGLGCDVAQIFNLVTNVRTLSERYLLASTGGSVSMIASNNLQYQEFHRNYLPVFYNSISSVNYGGTIGDHHLYAYNTMRNSDTSDFVYYQIESLLLQGDPALSVFGPSKPDYHISSERISSIPSNVDNTIDSFTLKIVAYNLGKALRDTVHVKVEHINPAGTITVINSLNLVNLFNTDTVAFKVAVNPIADVGLNKYRVTIDDDNKYDEVSEANNVGTLDLFIYSDNLIPVYPKEFAIVNQQNITLKASTLNPFRAIGKYKIEIDTTQLFNSSLKQQTSITSLGGVIKWTPTITFNDSTVYYWRTAYDSSINGNYQWTNSSFIYLAHGSDGWNQSHYYQYLEDNFTKLNYGTDRTFKFPIGTNIVTASNAIYADLIPGWPWNTADFVKVMLNGVDVQRLGCLPWGGTIQFNVFDSVTNALWANGPNGTSGSYTPCLAINNSLTFEFPVNTQQGRNNAAHFLDSIPNGDYVLVRNIINLGAYDTAFVNVWKTDPGNSLYQQLIAMGFTDIDSFNQIRPFIFFRQKGSNNYPVYQYYGQTWMDTLVKNFYLPTLNKQGELNSTVIGPALKWNQLKWQSSAIDNNAINDKPYVNIYGIDTTNNTALLYQGYTKDTSLNFINATQYPNIKLVWTSYDSVNLTSPQLDFWRVLYNPVPEAALNPAAYYSFNDSLQVGQMFNFAVAIEDLTPIPMDSMLVKYKVIDANSNTHLIASQRYKKLSGNDTLHASLTFDPKSYPGKNVFFVEANPDNDQPEQYHPNNLGYIPFSVTPDLRNPLVDVTFDGIHILDKDIVSSKPFIKIVLRDDNKFLALDDTSLLKVSIRNPDEINTSHSIPFDGTICKFIPANLSTGKNEATIEYRPTFLEDGTYTLFVNGSDKSGNTAGSADYQVAFDVINKSSITNILNYPNPFSTSTAFLFTITGSQLPSQFKIQILTVTGKVVREITKQEIGPIHIGRNITEYKWDGKDQYGQMLGNGVYLYRVITSIDGNSIDHRNSGADKFYKNGYGKMYIMR